MLIYIDIDKTICKTNGMSYKDAIPIKENINKVNKLYEQNHTIVMWTARGTMTGINWFRVTYDQLIKWNVKFHELKMGKPAYDLFIDDKSINSLWDWTDRSTNMLINKESELYNTIKNCAIIIQARTNSSRLKNKIQLPFYNNKTILDIQLEKLSKNKFNIPIIVATTNNKIDDDLYEHILKKNNIYCFRGDENNVLDRYIQCANTFKKNIIIRVCSDNPFISVKHIEKLVEHYHKKNMDYITYSIDNENPSVKAHIGIFAELITLETLNKITKYTSDKKYTEHVTNYVYENKDKFFVRLLKSPFNINKNIRLTVDTIEDFTLLKNLYSKTINMPIENIIRYVSSNRNLIQQMEKIINKNPK